MNNLIFQSLSEKYEVLSPLGCGQNGFVYLIRHKSLDRVMAVKAIPKDTANDHSVLSEARLLKSLHHPGIPMIYDIEEDTSFYYLMEEYVEGPSLDRFLLHHKFISKSFYLKSMKELCEIYDYLHHLPQPFLYQDLKPEHMIVGEDGLKLIDFGGLLPLHPSQGNHPLFGNADFSAPEVLAGETSSIRSDVYTIGKMMEYLSAYLPSCPETIQRIFHKATNPLPEDRQETVADLLAAIDKEQTCGSSLAKSIAVIGAHAGCGATHQAIALTSSLNQMGISSFYLEENDSGAMRKLSHFAANIQEEDGYLTYRQFLGYPKWGPGLSVSLPSEELAVIDCGTDWSDGLLSEASQIILVCGSGPWHMEDLTEKVKELSLFREKITLLLVGADAYLLGYLKDTLSLPVVLAPFSADPFSVTKASCRMAAKLLGRKERFSFISNLRNTSKRFREP